MIPILTPAESASLDRASAERGVTVEALMENAGHAVARAVLTVTGGGYGRRGVVLCGKGNNGGDGLVAARLLRRRGMGLTALLMAEPPAFAGPAAAALRRYRNAGGRVRRFDSSAASRELARADVVVDAMFGTGFRGRPEGAYAEAIDAVNDCAAPVVAVDIPSGVEGETGAVRAGAVQADVTVTFGALKPGLVLYPGAANAGVVQVADIGFPPDLLSATAGDLWQPEATDVGALLPPRPVQSNKRSVGTVLVVAGSRTMTGAAVLAATSAYRAGAGLVTLAVPEGILRVVQPAVPEAVFLPLPETSDGTVAEEAWAVVSEQFDRVQAAAIGPGLTTNDDTQAFVRRFVAESPVAFVLDADGLNVFKGRGSSLAERRSPAVVTPHPAEFGRLTGLTTDEVAEDRLGHARKAAAEFGCPVLLKGARTIVADPGGRAVVNPTGSPNLATGGAGDVLTGVIAAFLARGLSPFDSGLAGAFVHGLAGDLAAAEVGETTVATDLPGRLPRVLSSLREGL